MGLFLSANVLACNAIEDMSAQVRKKSLTPEQIQLSLDKWKAEELAKINSTSMIQFQNEIAPAGLVKNWFEMPMLLKPNIMKWLMN
ncbi:hypothetical protein [Vibrio cidicii]|uniref:hypothetical protein n=1 Tax=Vibrio cidicii TaxID=1763883 RepID=UPI001E2E56CD|nr:hypothetical protein [Vibrio cidicii]